MAESAFSIDMPLLWSSISSVLFASFFQENVNRYLLTWAGLMAFLISQKFVFQIGKEILIGQRSQKCYQYRIISISQFNHLENYSFEFFHQGLNWQCILLDYCYILNNFLLFLILEKWELKMRKRPILFHILLTFWLIIV